MKPAFIYSKKDIAGKNIAKFVDERTEHPLIEVEEDIIYAKVGELQEEHGFDYAIMLSRHKSKSEKPCFTVHAPGNFSGAKYGGEERTLAETVAMPMHRIYLELKKTDLPYTVCREATHHGPTPDTPLFFVELGSSERRWRDEEAAEFIADSVIEGLASEEDFPVALGFGGGHYCPRFSEKEDVAFGHVCPDYALEHVDENIMKQMTDKIAEKVDEVFFDSVDSEKKKLIKNFFFSKGISVE